MYVCALSPDEIVLRQNEKKLTDELVVLALLDVHTDLHIGDDVVGEDVVLGAAVVVGDVGRVAPLVGVQTVCKNPRKFQQQI